MTGGAEGLRHPLPLRTSADTEGDVQRVLAKLEAGGRDMTVVRLLANSPNGFRPFVLMADALLSRGSLAPTTREAIVLHLAVRQDSDYEWFEHEPMARSAGLGQDQIDAIRDGKPFTAPLFDDEQIAARRFVEVLLDDGPIRDVWDDAVDVLGREPVLDLTLAVAWWAGFVPLALRAFLPVADGAPDVPPRA